MADSPITRKMLLVYKEHSDWSSLPSSERILLEKAWTETNNAYAPYSNFRVGASLELENGILIPGSNQENASFPAGLCAERVAIFAAMGQQPGVKVQRIAITAINKENNLKRPVYPCGFCAQVLIDLEERQNAPVSIILGLKDGGAVVMESAKMLLPFSFSKDDL